MKGIISANTRDALYPDHIKWFVTLRFRKFVTGKYINYIQYRAHNQKLHSHTFPFDTKYIVHN